MWGTAGHSAWQSMVAPGWSSMTPTSAPLRSRSRTSHSGSHVPARRLMLAEGLDAASAAFEVGYESASQFNREYSRFFGSAPTRDIARLRQDTRAWA